MFLIIQNKPPSEFRPNFSNQQKKSQILTTFQQLQKAASLSPPPVQKRQLHAAKLFTTHRCVLVERGGIRSRGTELCICGVYEKERKNFYHLATPDGNGTCAGEIKIAPGALKSLLDDVGETTRERFSFFWGDFAQVSSWKKKGRTFNHTLGFQEGKRGSRWWFAKRAYVRQD